MAVGARPPAVRTGLARSVRHRAVGRHLHSRPPRTAAAPRGTSGAHRPDAGCAPVPGRAPPPRPGHRRHPPLAGRLAGVGGMGGSARRTVPLRPGAVAWARLAVVGDEDRELHGARRRSRASCLRRHLRLPAHRRALLLPRLRRRRDATPAHRRVNGRSAVHVDVRARPRRRSGCSGLPRPPTGQRPPRVGNGRRTESGRLRPARRLGGDVRARGLPPGHRQRARPGWHRRPLIDGRRTIREWCPSKAAGDAHPPTDLCCPADTSGPEPSEDAVNGATSGGRPTAWVPPPRRSPAGRSR